MKKSILTAYLVAISLFSFSQEAKDSSLSCRFMVFSDPHYYDPSLGTGGAAFQHYLDHDRKLLKESRELLIEAINLVNNSEADFILVPGDLTKDGTRVSHEAFAALMHEIEKNGKQVYVVPGNHDISNGESKAFRGDSAILVDNIDAEDFSEIYRNFGFGEAISRDSSSLSYLVEPVQGLWILALDACRYRENKSGSHPITDGRFSNETLAWIEEMAGRAAQENKKLLAFMHHGIIEHYEKQERFFGEYVVDDYKKVSKLFAGIGINVVFTGHFHSQDITIQNWKDGNFIVDVETGSLVTYPCPLREVSLAGDQLTIRSHFITEIPSYPESFEQFSMEYAHAGIAGIAEAVMISMWLKPEDAAKLSGQIGDAFIAHYRGDEPIVERYLDVSGVGLLGRLMILTKRRLIKELHTDLYPADNQIIIDLRTGTTE